jgi:hypothetical protein
MEIIQLNSSKKITFSILIILTGAILYSANIKGAILGGTLIAYEHNSAPTIDGQIISGEWDNADTKTFTLLAYDDDPIVYCTAYTFHFNNILYFAFSLNMTVQRTGEMGIFFQTNPAIPFIKSLNESDGVIFNDGVDLKIANTDGIIYDGFMNESLMESDLDYFGTVDFDGAGVRYTDRNDFEFAIPFTSTDVNCTDVSITMDSTINIFLYYAAYYEYTGINTDDYTWKYYTVDISSAKPAPSFTVPSALLGLIIVTAVITIRKRKK